MTIDPHELDTQTLRRLYRRRVDEASDLLHTDGSTSDIARLLDEATALQVVIQEREDQAYIEQRRREIAREMFPHFVKG